MFPVWGNTDIVLIFKLLKHQRDSYYQELIRTNVLLLLPPIAELFTF